MTMSSSGVINLGAHEWLGRPHPEQPLCGRCRGGPRGAAGDDGVDEDDELASTGDESRRVRLSGCEETLVEGLQLRVPVKDSRQRSRVEALPQSLTPALDVSRAVPQAAVIVIGSETNDGGS